MKKKETRTTTDKNKILAISTLYVIAVVIMALGAFFSVYSLINDISFRVLTTHVHGAVFGLVAFYLGLRYFLSVSKLRDEVYKNTSRFSWSNFKSEKSRKSS